MYCSLDKIYALFEINPVISTDTRALTPNSIFFAIKGDRYNANAFAASALEQGCSYAVIDEEEYALDERFLLVKNVTETLQQLARLYRSKLAIPVIGITGTNGKTTTKELVNAVLSQSYRTHATKGNLNNHLGVPLTILSAPKSTEILIVEMGANHPGEIAELCDMAEPDYGIITSLGLAHLEGFGSVENIIQTKTALYSAVKKQNGLVFVDRDNSVLMDYTDSQKRITYGTSNADYTGKLLDSETFINILFEGTTIHSQLFGKYNFANILAACAIGSYFKVSSEKIKTAIENYQPSNNRSQIKKTEKNTIILDAYNANPSSMKLAIESFSEQKNAVKFFILGDMLELGKNSIEEHKKIIELLDELNLKDGIFVGEIFKNIIPERSYKTVEDVQNAIENKAFTLTNNLILVKGSRGIRLENLVDKL